MNNKIELYRSENEVLNDAIDRIVVEIHKYKKEQGRKSLLLTGCGSKSGTTTISINLAISLALAGWKTLFVDCDLRKGSSYKRLNEQLEFGLTDFLYNDIGAEELIYATNARSLDYVPSGTIEKSPVKLLCSNKMETLHKKFSNEYDYIIYDFPSINIVPDVSIFFPYADGILLVGALEQTTKTQLQEARQKVAKYQDKYYGLIINKIDMTQYKKHRRDYDYFEQKNMKRNFIKNMRRKGKEQE